MILSSHVIRRPFVWRIQAAAQRRFGYSFICALFWLGPAAVAQPAEPWGADAAALLKMVRNDESQQAAELAAAQLRTERDPAVRRELRAVLGITMLYSPDRPSQVDGRTLLVELIREFPPLAARGECRQALGSASLALRETSSALEHFAAAADDFETRGAAAEFADALEGLARTWVVHAEWEMTPRRFGVTAPAGPEQIRAIRDHQFEELMRRAARLPLSGAADRVRLVQAQRFLMDTARMADAIEILEQLCPDGRRDRVAGQAALRLADVYEQAQNFDALRRVLVRAEMCENAGLAAAARERLAALRRPRLELSSSLEAAPGEKPSLRLRARNLARLSAEIRRIDLGAWLQEKQGRFFPAQLATGGSVVWSRNWEIPTAAEEWWSTPEGEDEPRLPADAGAYVLELRGESPDAAPLVQRHLVTISGLRAVAFIGDSRVAVWGERRDGGPAPPAIAARFWVFGSFQPTRFELRDGSGVFRLPAEARLLRDRRWSMLLESDLGPLFLSDALPLRGEEADSVGSYIITASAAETPESRRFTVTGALLEENTPAPKLVGREDYRLFLIDTDGAEIASAPLQMMPGGVFSADVSLSDPSLARHLAIVVRRGIRNLFNVVGRYTLPGATDEFSDAQLQIALKNPDERGQHDEIPVEFSAWFPWNVALKDAMVFWGGRLVALPTHETPAWGTVYPSGERNRMDARGRAEGHAARFADRPFDQPTLFGVWATLRGWDGRRVSSVRQFLLGPHRRHAWLTLDPPLATAEQPISIAAGWIDADTDSFDAWPSVRIARGEEICADLPLHAGPRGLRTPDWVPPQAGDYIATLRWPDFAHDQTPPVARLDFRAESAASSPVAAAVSAGCSAVVRFRDGAKVCDLRADAQPAGARVAALLIGERDPLGVVELSPQTAAATARVADEIPRRVIFFRWSGDRLARVGETRVESRLGGALTLSIEPQKRRAIPGEAVRVCARVSGDQPAGEVTLVARLVSAGSESGVQWADGDWRSDEVLDATIAVSAAPAADRHGDSAAGDWIAVERNRSAAELFFSDAQTLWTSAAVAQDGIAEFEVPVPRTPGGYRILVYAAAQNTPGVVAQDFIAVRDGYVLRAFVPENYCVGDRVQVVIQLISANPRRATAAEPIVVTADSGGLLVLEPMASVSDFQREVPGRCRWSISPAPETSAIFTVEARAAGTGVLRIACPGGEAVPLEVPIRVSEPISAGQQDRTIRVKRSFVRMVAYESEEVPEMDPRAESRLFGYQWQRFPIDPAREHVVPGQVLLVREEVESPMAIPDLTWRQIISANALSILDRPTHMPEVAPIRLRRPDRLEFSGSLIPGRTTHEYFIVAARGGSCELPPPAVFAGDRPVRVEMVDGETRMTVTGSPGHRF